MNAKPLNGTHIPARTVQLADQIVRGIEENIAHQGVAMIGVEGNPPCIHTVGMMDHGFPEVIFIGYFHEYVTAAMVQYLRDLLVGLERPGPGSLSYFSHPVEVIEVEKAKGDLFAEIAASRGLITGRQVTYVQWVWTDENGLFPWDEGCDAAVVRHQPLLGARK